MRPHTVAAIAVLLFFLTSPNINKSYFYIELLVKKMVEMFKKKSMTSMLPKPHPTTTNSELAECGRVSWK